MNSTSSKKIKKNPSEKNKLMREILAGVKELNLIKQGKKKARNVEDLLNEL
jgi:hypothetical protein